MVRLNHKWVAYQAGKEIDAYMKQRAWHWTVKKNFAIATDYCIRVLNRHPKDPLALVLGRVCGLACHQQDFADKCGEALARLRLRNGANSELPLVKDTFAKDLGKLVEELEADAAARSKQPATGLEDEKIVVTESEGVERLQVAVKRCCQRAGNQSAVAEVRLPVQSAYGRGLYATERLSPRQPILVESPLLVQRMDGEHCSHCLAPLAISAEHSHIYGTPCLHCEEETFCSPECRDAAWSQYHACCCSSVNRPFAQWSAMMWEGVSASMTTEDTSSVARASLSCLAVAKLCAMGTMRATHPLALEGIRGLRGIAEYEPQTALSEVGALSVTLAEALRQPQLYLEDVLSLFALLQTNEFLQSGGIALYAVLSLLNHSCVPNCCIVKDSEADRRLVALKEIRQGEQLFIDYNSNLTTALNYDQRKALCSQRYFECFCPKCIRRE